MLRNILMVLCLLSTTNSQAQKHSKKDYKTIGKPLPQLKIVTLDGKTITNKDLNNKANLVVMLFNPICEHCQDETQLLESNIALFKQSKLLMITAPMMGSYLKTFVDNYHISQYSKNIMIGLDSGSTINNLFTYEPLPQLNVYNAKRKLIKVFSGNTSIDSLKPYIQ
ncbi:MAG: redoxin domain-containing protein [Bacteroidetes bacterium]|nr:redoxin domain-containing protein [Bacteroidota bacterium]